MRQCLNLSNIICVKSTLHGLGHLHCYHPEAAGIVRHFLTQPDELIPTYCVTLKPLIEE